MCLSSSVLCDGDPPKHPSSIVHYSSEEQDCNRIHKTIIMARSKAQGRKGKQKNKAQGAEEKKNGGGNDKIVTKKETQVKQPNDKMSRSERSKMIKAKYAAGEIPDRKKMTTRSKAQNEKPKSNEDIDKEMEDYEVAVAKLDEVEDSYCEQMEAVEADGDEAP